MSGFSMLNLQKTQYVLIIGYQHPHKTTTQKSKYSYEGIQNFTRYESNEIIIVHNETSKAFAR